MESWILVLISSKSLPLVIGITHKWELLPSWILCGEIDGAWSAPGQCMGHFSVCNRMMFWRKLLVKSSAKVLFIARLSGHSPACLADTLVLKLQPKGLAWIVQLLSTHLGKTWRMKRCLQKQHMPNALLIYSASDKRAPRCVHRETYLSEMHEDPINDRPDEHSHLLVFPHHKHISKTLRNYAISPQSQNKSNTHHILC